MTVQESGLGGKGCSISYRFVEDSSQNTGNLEDMVMNAYILLLSFPYVDPSTPLIIFNIIVM